MQRSVFLFVTAILMGYAPATIAQGPASLPRATPESQGVSSKALQAFIGELHSKVNTMHSVMVVRHGKVIADGPPREVVGQADVVSAYLGTSTKAP